MGIEGTKKRLCKGSKEGKQELAENTESKKKKKIMGAGDITAYVHSDGSDPTKQEEIMT